MPSLSTPQQRSDQARKAVQARWEQARRLEMGELYTLVKPLTPEPSPWVATRRCLRLEQDPDGSWLLLTPAGNRLPATAAEVSLWLDLQEALSPSLQGGQGGVDC
jgi:hypothetical protein